MNVRYVISQLGLVIGVLTLAIAVVAAWAGVLVIMGHQEDTAALRALLEAVLIGAGASAVFWLIGRSGEKYLGRREALLLVALSWIVGAGYGAMPFWLWAIGRSPTAAAHPFDSFVDCYFETMSGLTTTGATVLTDIATVPNELLLWRAATHWLGGLGIVVLFVAVLPSLGVGGKRLFQVESPGPTPVGVRPRIRETARLLWMMYLGLTVAQIIALRVCGMSWFDSICHTFATLATGGFSTYNASIGAHAFTPAMQWVVILFMLLAGINFGLYYHLLRGSREAFFRDREFRLYLTIIFCATLFVMWQIWGQPIPLTTGGTDQPGLETTLRHSLFQVIAIQTTTGFATADFDQWPNATRLMLVGLMFIGASAGSTGGGIKVIRILVAVKVLFAELERVFRPTVVRPIRIGAARIDPELRMNAIVYILIVLLIFAAGGVLLMLLEPGIDVTTAITASAATIHNIGPGLNGVGAVENYAWFSDASKLVMTLLMAIGRLEVYAIFVLFLPYFWRGE